MPDWALTAAERHSEIADAGHMVMRQAPEVFGRVLAELLSNESPSS